MDCDNTQCREGGGFLSSPANNCQFLETTAGQTSNTAQCSASYTVVGRFSVGTDVLGAGSKMHTFTCCKGKWCVCFVVPSCV
jgi:hypothetical protein